MNDDKRPSTTARSNDDKLRPSTSTTTATKRSSFAADLRSSASPAKRVQVFTSSLSHASLERQLVAAHSVKVDLDAKLRDREATIDRLERDRRWLADREAAEREEKERERAVWDDEKRTLTADLRALRTTLSALRESHADLEDTRAALARSSAHAAAAHKAQLATLTHRASLLEDELTHTRALLDQRSASTSASNSDAPDTLDAPSASSPAQAQGHPDNALILSELQNQTTHLRTLERTNTRLSTELATLRARATSVAVLQEQKLALETRLRAMEPLRRRVAELEAAASLSSSSSFSSSFSSSLSSSTATLPEPSTPPPITQTHALASLRLAHATLLASTGTLTSELAAARAELADLGTALGAAEARVGELEGEKGGLEEALGRARAGTEAAEGEGRFLRRLVASYAAEAQAQVGDEGQEQGKEEREVQARRVAHLEGLVDEYREMNARLNAELDARGGGAGVVAHDTKPADTSASPSSDGEKDAQLKDLEQRLETATASIDALEQELFELQGEMAGGRHVPPGTRVLQLRDNPASQWAETRQEALDGLRRENEALLRRLAELGSGPAGSPNPTPNLREGQDQDQDQDQGGASLVPRASLDLLQHENMTLHQSLLQREKRLLRLQQVYNAKGAEFRDAIASVLGVKLVFKPNGQVRVTSVFDLGASFVFAPSPGQGKAQGQGGQGQGQGGEMRMQLVAQGEGGPQDLPDLMQFWIGKEQCLPGFMASVTLECYENAKRAGREEGEGEGGI